MVERQGQRATTVGVLVLAAVVGVALVTLDHDDTPTPEPVVVAAGTNVTTSLAAATTAPPATTTADGSTTTATAAAAAAPSTTDPGALPQTDERPTASGAAFTAGVQDLWEAIRQDKPELGLPFFFLQPFLLRSLFGFL